MCKLFINVVAFYDEMSASYQCKDNKTLAIFFFFSLKISILINIKK